MSQCTVQVTGTATGAACVGYGNCDGSCCTETYTNCTGTGGVGCIAYGNCSGTCCTETPTLCTGTISFVCNTASDKTECESGNYAKCCDWTIGPPVECIKKANCGVVDPYDCATCGCSTSGTCVPKACSILSQGNCEPCGCDENGTCTQLECNELVDNNPDVCAGCDTCGGDWQINDARGILPWTVYVTGEVQVSSGGSADSTSLGELQVT